MFSKSKIENLEEKYYTVKSDYKVEDGRWWSVARAVSLRQKHLGNEEGSRDELGENLYLAAMSWQHGGEKAGAKIIYDVSSV